VGLDRPGPPGNQQNQKEQNGQGDADGQGPHHAVGPALVPVEEEKSGEETHDDGREQHDHQDLDHSGIILDGRLSRRWLGPWWAVLLTTVGVAVGSSAGLWQLGRAAEKRELEVRFAAGGTTGALQQLVANEAGAEFRYRTVRLAGRYDAEHQLLLDNISHERQPGYQVLTPFATAGGTVLVNRGWVPANGDRRILPDIRVGGEAREVLGRIDALPRPGIELAADAPPADAPWPRRLLFPTSAEASSQLGVPLRDYQLLLDPGEPDGYLRDWRPGGMGPDRHVAYAVQWFGLALTVVVIYFVLVSRNGKPPS